MRDSGFLLGNDNISLVFFHHHESQIIDSFHISFHSALTKIALILQSDAVELAPSTVKTTVVFFSSSVELIYDVQEKKGRLYHQHFLRKSQLNMAKVVSFGASLLSPSFLWIYVSKRNSL